MTAPAEPASIEELEPLEAGGPTARIGLAYQDHVAVGFCVEMLTEGIILAVWCELHDDILLVCEQSGNRWVEFIQVKAERRDSYWSPASICEREKSKPGTSIVERQLAHARCTESKRFRLITLTDVAKALRVLTHPIGSSERTLRASEVTGLLNDISVRIKDFAGDAAAIAAWLDAVLWEVRGAEDAVRARNREQLARFLGDRFDFTAPDHIDAVYEFLYRIVENAGRARVPPPYAEKKIPGAQLLSEVTDRVSALKRPRAASGGNPLIAALMDAGVDSADVEHALSLRARYLAGVRRQEFLLLRHPQPLYDDVKDVLFRVRMSYQPTACGDSPRTRHDRCLHALDELHGTLPPDARVPMAVLHGMMYDLVFRGLHGFRVEGDG